MRNLTATICLTIALLLGNVAQSESAEKFRYENIDGTLNRQSYQMTGDLPWAITPDLKKVIEYLQDGNMRSALKELEAHAENKLSTSHYEALHNLGVIYYRGIGVQKNYSIALGYIERAKEVLHMYHFSNVLSARIIQSALKILGFYKGKVDGDWGPNTQKSFNHAVETLKYDQHTKNEKDQTMMLVKLVDDTWDKEGIKIQDAQKVSPPVPARKSPPPSKSAAELENERLRRENARLKQQNQSQPKQIAKRPPPKASPTPESTSGSGFFISKSGHVLTNQHVVDNCKKVTVGDNSKKQVAADVLEIDRRNDLALLKISSMKMASAETRSLIQKLGITVVPLASDGLLRSEGVELGEDVLVAGYPYGEIFSNSIKVTKGIVSANRGLGDDTGQFQIDAAVQPGNSGGPIYDGNGNIVGVVVSQLNKMKFAKATGSIPENVNFGIKASTVRQFLTTAGLPTKWAARSETMTTKELAKTARNQTVMVVCQR
jgi:S1-C subfamily serine protease